MLDQKGTEPLAAEFDRLVREYREPYPESTQQEAWNLIADFAIENADTISRALSTITPAEVGGLVDAQTEARAIAAQLADYTYTLDPNVVICDRRVVDEAVTALAAKDAELAEARAQLQRQFEQTVRFQGYLVETKAQLAEARKALKAIEKEAKKNKPDPDKIWEIAYCALEGGNND